jgi:hypothetical protein
MKSALEQFCTEKLIERKKPNNQSPGGADSRAGTANQAIFARKG